jgi:hypothetical protein
MSLHRRLLRATLCASASLPLLFLIGCSDDGTVTTGSTTNLARGNWQISSAATAAAKLPVFSGEFTAQADKISAILHTQSAASCVPPTASFELAGSADSKNVVTLTGPLGGGTLSVTGTLAADGKSLSHATYNVVGGSCALAAKVQAVAQAFTPITGNYAGKFADGDGQIAQVTANFSQSTAPDANGNFTLAGTATIAGDPCFPSAVPVTNTQVTGDTFTYTLSANGTNVVATGTFSADASTLTVTNWNSSGSCGTDVGVQSTMTRQGS